MSDRIKKINKKEQDGFVPYPIGTDGQLVDMLSGLDLEQELKIGGNHRVAIRQRPNFENETWIDEWYYDTDIVEEGLPSSSAQREHTKYYVSTNISEASTVTTISSSIYSGYPSTSSNLLHIKKISIPSNTRLVQDIFEEVN